MNAHLLRLVVCVILCVAGSGVLLAHEDTLIQVKGGALIGLPEKYAPAELDTKAFRIRIGNHEMTFSPLLKSLFDQPHELLISASWYHDPRILPPYILLNIQPQKKDFSYRLLLNLDTLELIELSVVLHESDSATRELPIALHDQRKKEIKESIRTLK